MNTSVGDSEINSTQLLKSKGLWEFVELFIVDLGCQIDGLGLVPFS